ncbi:unnamed protein product [Phyllotreta striolata]|uniref:Uncharacterized protein n=1 Tax=Phyllotreta striolata TaxID=444603 RepID=A0A9N9XT10_PHYSR|nr:unnamed protein product [Phyllotreta striolata]
MFKLDISHDLSCLLSANFMKMRFNIKGMLNSTDPERNIASQRAICECRFDVDSSGLFLCVLYAN